MVFFSPSSCASIALWMKPRVLPSTSCLTTYSNLSSYSLMLYAKTLNKSIWASHSGEFEVSLHLVCDLILWLRHLVTRFSLWGPGFDSKPVHMALLVDNMALGQVFLSCTLIFPSHCHSTIASCSSIHLPLMLHEFPALLGGTCLPIPVNKE